MNTPNSIKHTKLTGYSVEYVDLREAKTREHKFKTMVYDGEMLKALEMLGKNVTDHIEDRFAKGGYKVIAIKKVGSIAAAIDLKSAYSAEMERKGMDY